MKFIKEWKTFADYIQVHIHDIQIQTKKEETRNYLLPNVMDICIVIVLFYSYAQF